MEQVTCASLEYLQRKGRSQCLDDLLGHQVVEYFSSTSGKRYGLEFQVGDEVRLIDLPKQVSVNSADGYMAACEAGYGLVQTPYYHVARQLRDGSLCEILRNIPPPRLPLTALYPPHRQLSQRVRVFVDWLVDLCSREQIGFQRPGG
jgi:DNA-binding transcriptional LysR family regulator